MLSVFVRSFRSFVCSFAFLFLSFFLFTHLNYVGHLLFNFSFCLLVVVVFAGSMNAHIIEINKMQVRVPYVRPSNLEMYIDGTYARAELSPQS